MRIVKTRPGAVPEVTVRGPIIGVKLPVVVQVIKLLLMLAGGSHREKGWHVYMIPILF